MLQGLTAVSVRHPRATCAIILGVVVISATGITGARLQLDGRALIPYQDTSLERTRHWEQVFAAHSRIVLLLHHPKGVLLPGGVEYLERAKQGLAALPGVQADNVTSILSVPHLGFQEGVLAQHVVGPDRGFSQMHAEIERLGWNDGILISHDERTAAILGHVKPSADLRQLANETQKLIRELDGNGWEVRAGGPVIAQEELGRVATTELLSLLPLSIGLLALLLTWMFGHPFPAILSLSEILLSLFWTAGLAGWSHQQIFITTLILPVVVLTVGVADDVLLMRNLLDHPAREKDVSQSVASMVKELEPAMLKTTLLSCVGLASLAFADLAPLRLFGVFAPMAILFSSLMTFTWVPAVWVWLAPRRLKLEGKAFHRDIRPTMNSLPLGRDKRRIIFAVLVVAALWAVWHLRINDSWLGNLPRTSAAVQADRTCDHRMSGCLTLEFAITPPTGVGLNSIESLTALADLEARLERFPVVGAIDGYHVLLGRIAAALLEIPFRDLRPHLGTDPRLTPALLAQAELVASPVLLHFEPLTDPLNQTMRMIVFLKGGDYQQIKAILAQVDVWKRTTGKRFSLDAFGDAVLSQSAVEMLVIDQRRSLIFSLFSDLVLLIFLLRSVRAALAAMLAIIAALLCTLACISGTNIAIGIANSMFLSVGIGLGGDYSVHCVSAFLSSLRQGMSVDSSILGMQSQTGGAIITSSISLTTGFMVMLLSAVPPNWQLGLLLILTVGWCAFCVIFLLPSMLGFFWSRTLDMGGLLGLNARV